MGFHHMGGVVAGDKNEKAALQGGLLNFHKSIYSTRHNFQQVNHI